MASLGFSQEGLRESNLLASEDCGAEITQHFPACAQKREVVVIEELAYLQGTHHEVH
jgi:hypothetical protein